MAAEADCGGSGFRVRFSKIGAVADQTVRDPSGAATMWTFSCEQTEDNVNGAQLGDRLWELTVSFGKIEGKDGESAFKVIDGTVHLIDYGRQSTTGYLPHLNSEVPIAMERAAGENAFRLTLVAAPSDFLVFRITRELEVELA